MLTLCCQRHLGLELEHCLSISSFSRLGLCILPYTVSHIQPLTDTMRIVQIWEVWLFCFHLFWSIFFSQSFRKTRPQFIGLGLWSMFSNKHWIGCLISLICASRTWKWVERVQKEILGIQETKSWHISLILLLEQVITHLVLKNYKNVFSYSSEGQSLKLLVKAAFFWGLLGIIWFYAFSSF